MEANRELDALIAEKVLGITGIEHGDSDWWEEDFPLSEGWLIRDHDYREVPHYSTDIAAAWQIVELMTSRMGYQNLGFRWVGPVFKPETDYLDTTWPLGTTCWYVMVEADGRREYLYADTAPLAICSAALAAIGQPSPSQ